MFFKLILFSILALFSFNCVAQTEEDDFDSFGFDDAPLVEEITHPIWFKQSFFDLSEDLAEAKDQGKEGIIVYFGQKNCAYCKALMENNFGQADIKNYTREHFDVIPINIWGSSEVTTIDDVAMTEREYAIQENANFTPSLIFYDTEGKKTLMLRGYYPPYKFRAALEYVVEGYYQQESFRNYLARANPPASFELGELNSEPFFIPAPFALDRTRIVGQKPLLVVFEQRDCHSCDVLHSEPLSNPDTKKLLNQFEVVQIDILSDVPVLTPSGDKITGKAWADKLNLFYTPTLIAFDEKGREIMRIDSVAGVYRLKNVLQYIATKTYIKTPNFMDWTFNRLFNGNKLPENQ
jgi:thioredoxin-related protein